MHRKYQRISENILKIESIWKLTNLAKQMWKLLIQCIMYYPNIHTLLIHFVFFLYYCIRYCWIFRSIYPYDSELLHSHCNNDVRPRTVEVVSGIWIHRSVWICHNLTNTKCKDEHHFLGWIIGLQVWFVIEIWGLCRWLCSVLPFQIRWGPVPGSGGGLLSRCSSWGISGNEGIPDLVQKVCDSLAGTGGSCWFVIEERCSGGTAARGTAGERALCPILGKLPCILRFRSGDGIPERNGASSLSRCLIPTSGVSGSSVIASTEGADRRLGWDWALRRCLSVSSSLL